MRVRELEEGIQIILAGGSEAASFNDDTSPDTRMTARSRVCIDAQVIPEKPLDWYYRLLSFCPDLPAELKSTSLVPRFNALPVEARNSIWSGLSGVRIHIVDPRPYRYRIDDLLRRVWGRNDAPALLSQAVAQGLAGAKRLQDRLRECMVHAIIGDSTASRVRRLSRVYNPRMLLGVPILDNTEPEEALPAILPIEMFGRDKAIVRKATNWSAKSSAAFHGALDCLEDIGQEVYLFQVPERLIRRRMFRTLQTTHAFDRGNERELQVLEEARRNIIAELDGLERAYTVPLSEAFVQIDSRDSFYIQAADFAARIAGAVYGSEGLTRVASRFEYVTYNGRRVSKAEAEEKTREIRRH